MTPSCHAKQPSLARVLYFNANRIEIWESVFQRKFYERQKDKRTEVVSANKGIVERI